MKAVEKHVTVTGTVAVFHGKAVYHSNNKHHVAKANIVTLRLDSEHYPDEMAKSIDDFLKNNRDSTFKITLEKV